MCCSGTAHVSNQPMCMDPDTCTWFQQWQAHHSLKNSSRTENRWRAAHTEMHRCSWEEVISVLRRYLIAMAAKDCSIMCAFHVDEKGRSERYQGVAPHVYRACQGAGVETKKCEGCESAASSIRRLCTPCTATGHLLAPDRSSAAHTCFNVLSSTEHTVKYRMAVVDVDCKHVCKIPVQETTDQAILKCCRRIAKYRSSCAQ